MYTSLMRSARKRQSDFGASVRVILPVVLVGLACSPAVFAAPVEERYHYAITVWGIPAGNAMMRVEDVAPEGQRSLRRLVTTAQSNDVISFFFPVKNEVDSLVDIHTMLPQRLVFHRREGSRHEDFDVRFDHVANQVTVLKNGQLSVHAIAPGTHDLLSCVYFLRTIPVLEPGSSVHVNVYHDQKNYRVEVKVEAVEQVAGPWGTVEAIRLLAVMPFHGIFLNEGNVRFWLTNTEARIPVMMEARVIIGSVRARIEGWAPSP